MDKAYLLAALNEVIAAAYERLEPLTGPGRTALQHTIDDLRDLRTELTQEA